MGLQYQYCGALKGGDLMFLFQRYDRTFHDNHVFLVPDEHFFYLHIWFTIMAQLWRFFYSFSIASTFIGSFAQASPGKLISSIVVHIYLYHRTNQRRRQAYIALSKVFQTSKSHPYNYIYIDQSRKAIKQPEIPKKSKIKQENTLV